VQRQAPSITRQRIGGAGDISKWAASRAEAMIGFGDHHDRQNRSSLPHGLPRSEEHTSELQSLTNLVCRLLLEKKNNTHHHTPLLPPRSPCHSQRFGHIRDPPPSPTRRSSDLSTATSSIYNASAYRWSG